MVVPRCARYSPFPIRCWLFPPTHGGDAPLPHASITYLPYIPVHAARLPAAAPLLLPQRCGARMRPLPVGSTNDRTRACHSSGSWTFLCRLLVPCTRHFLYTHYNPPVGSSLLCSSTALALHTSGLLCLHRGSNALHALRCARNNRRRYMQEDVRYRLVVPCLRRYAMARLPHSEGWRGGDATYHADAKTATLHFDNSTTTVRRCCACRLTFFCLHALPTRPTRTCCHFVHTALCHTHGTLYPVPIIPCHPTPPHTPLPIAVYLHLLGL